MIYLDIAVNVPLNQTFLYSYSPPEKKNVPKPAVGMRAEVPFGNRSLPGFITALYDEMPADCTVPQEKIRPIKKVLDTEPIFTTELFTLARWMSGYYLCAIGETLAAMIPSGRRETGAGGFSCASDIPVLTAHTLSDEQRCAVDGILSSTAEKKLFHYLYGPTGSGKTEVFLQAAEHVLARGKGVIYLVPEISLTQQVIEAVVTRFGNGTAVLHSKRSPGERLAEWRRIMRREARIVIGARSAIFSPVPDLGLIIIDEEHDSSYKSGSVPRYHARQVAFFRASREAVPVVMGSATPSVEAWHLMETGVIVKHTVTRRLAGGGTPQLVTVDLTKYPPHNGCLSDPLIHAMRQTIEKKRQVLLFLNRRGFTHFFRCANCGYELTCKNCSVQMTYHKNEHRLRCHYCGWSTVPPDSCPHCGSVDIGWSGFGTEYIEAETRAHFPNARIVRIDADSMKKKGALEEQLRAFRDGAYDILLGTQMVAKGLNFPHLELVGIVLADTGLHLPDFRAAERTFSLITQVAGRAGRFFPNGRVFVQTYSPSRTPIAYALTGDSAGFYRTELAERKALEFPPFFRLVRLVFRSPKQSAAAETAREAAAVLHHACRHYRGENSATILGPAECPLGKIAQNYRYQILLKGKTVSVLQKLAQELITSYTHRQQVFIEVDVDPVEML
ncbi:MAG: primosomal protein N' [Treponema sp.]|nr:primosomal protein N' [Treponema sp.]